VLEFVFADETGQDAVRQAPVVLAALDAAPDPVSGVLVHRTGAAGAAPAGRAVPDRGR
jgi:hypothetical protein